MRVVVFDDLASYGRKKLSTQDNYIPFLDTPDPHKQSTPATTTSHNVPVAPQAPQNPNACLPASSSSSSFLGVLRPARVFLPHPPLPTANRNFATSPPGSHIRLPPSSPLRACQISLSTILQIPETVQLVDCCLPPRTKEAGFSRL